MVYIVKRFEDIYIFKLRKYSSKLNDSSHSLETRQHLAKEHDCSWLHPPSVFQHLFMLDILLTCFSRSLMSVLSKTGPSTNPWGTLLDTCSNLISYHLSLLMLAVLKPVCAWPNYRNTVMPGKADCVNVFTSSGQKSAVHLQSRGRFLCVRYREILSLEILVIKS